MQQLLLSENKPSYFTHIKETQGLKLYQIDYLF